MTLEEIHEAGAFRHGGNWIAANQRAVEVSNRYGQTQRHKEMISEICLRILDGSKVSTGHKWDEKKGRWIKTRNRKS